MRLLQKSLVAFLVIAANALLFAGTTLASSDRQAYPNILVILVDDLGWHDVGYHNPTIGTPHIDELADSGVRLDQFYANPTCSPSRASLLTGLFSRSHGVHAPVTHTSEKGLPVELPLLPQFLSKVGYSTHLVGKWHL
ncbi:MAG: sulfatase-like hydrolase/transferase, partial [Pseudomonadota bacterium]|nr:sulfatase-like hydrolase/transferase [Pseudomonadota bacterium]